jgi:dolichyl-phosphate-mannose--protein O-mannosyl transferase
LALPLYRFTASSLFAVIQLIQHNYIALSRYILADQAILTWLI